jgi:hypothetical protein
MPLFGIYPKTCKSTYKRDNFTPIFTTILFTKSNLWNQLSCSKTDEWLQKMYMIYTHKRMKFHFKESGWNWR